MRRWLPWYAKMAAKITLARLPLGYRFWRKINLFAHGSMHKPEYAHGVFRQHFDRSEFTRKNGGFTALEIGPGDSLLSAVVANAYGASTCYLIDSGPFATEDMAPYRAIGDYLRSLNLSPPDLEEVSDLKGGLLAACNAFYGTRGLSSIRELPSSSVDFIWSHAVLEHIRRHEFPNFMRELRRVLRPDGFCSHRVDLKDHLGGALNNLRIPSRLWEADWMARSGFYTNRIRYSEMIELFRQADFDVNVISVARWDRLPTPRERMASEFEGFDDDDLLVSAFDVLLKPQ